MVGVTTDEDVYSVCDKMQQSKGNVKQSTDCKTDQNGTADFVHWVSNIKAQNSLNSSRSISGCRDDGVWGLRVEIKNQCGNGCGCVRMA